MSDSYPVIFFKSDSFPEREEEEYTINPGLFGEALAEYLQENLKKAGFPVEDIGSEDFGMYVPITNKDFRIYSSDTGNLCQNVDCAGSPSPHHFHSCRQHIHNPIRRPFA